MSEELSHTLMIEGVLGKLALKVEVTEARGIEEEEGLSSTPRREDNESNGVYVGE